MFRAYFGVAAASHTRTLALGFMGRVQVFRLSDDRERRLLFRGWSRLCLHAASLKAGEAAVPATAAAARVPPAEAMENNASIVAGTSEERESRNLQFRRAKSLVGACIYAWTADNTMSEFRRRGWIPKQ